MKLRLLLIFILAFLSNTYSQDKKIQFQLSLGPTFSIPKTSELANPNTEGSPKVKSSINIGAYILPSINYSLSKKSSLDLGVGFFLDRFSIENEIGPIISKGNRSTSQIQIPINFNFHFSKDKPFIIGAGGFTSFLISAKEKGVTKINTTQIEVIDPNDPFFSSGGTTTSYNENIKENYNSVNFGAFIQLRKNIKFSANKEGFILLRINQYFNAIKDNNSNSSLNQSFEYKNEKEPTTINLGIGILL